MSQDKWVVDASALLAAIHNEKGGDIVEKNIDRCIISAVNWSEVLQKLERADINTTQVESALKALGLEVLDFTDKDAHFASKLWKSSKTLGLSLADRACLATGIRLNTKVITADKIWAKMELDIEIVLIR